MLIEAHLSSAMTESDSKGAAAPATLAERIVRNGAANLAARWPALVAGAVAVVAVAAAGDWPWLGAAGALAALLIAVLTWPMSADRGGRASPVGAAREGAVNRAGQDGWRVVIDAMPEPALALDGAGVIVHQNALVVEIFPNARAGQPISYVSRNPELNAAIERALRAREQVRVQLLERIPVERRISAAVTTLDGATARNGLPSLLVTFRDLTEQDKLARMRADFIANASHELRTPLASLKGFVETLQGPARDDPETRARFLALMASQAARMTRLIDDLLSLSRAEMRVHLPPRGTVDLNDVAGYVTQTLEPLAQGSNIKVTVEKLDAPARIRGEREEIDQVLQNLVHNAIKYGRDGGAVKVAVVRTGERPPRIAVTVSDDGPGIAPEHLPRLTERFYRVNVASSRDKGGTGLGLAIVKHIVNRHRGELKIESRVGEGSTFTIAFHELRG